MPGRPLKICAMPTASDTAPPVLPATALADRGLELRQVDGRDAKLREHRGRRVDGEVVAREHRGRGDQGDDADEALHQHRAVPDRADVGFAIDHLRRRPRRDERVESGDRAARDGDERERERPVPG